MNGNKIPMYELETEKNTYCPHNGAFTKNEKRILNLKFKDLKIKKGDYLAIRYNFEHYFYFDIQIDEFLEEDETYKDIDFKILSGIGYGIEDDKSLYCLKSLLTRNRKDFEMYYSKSEKEYLQKRFDLTEINNKISEYIKNRKEQKSPKQYIFNVSLDGFNKEIKRKISVNNNIKIDDFCQKVITSMNGDLFHLYDIKIGKEYLYESYSEFELFYLNLKEKQKFKIIYDWGDNWIFNLTLTKIIDGHEANDFKVLSGKGYGIIDDCGGISELNDIFNGENRNWGKYDINNFDLERCNKQIEEI